VPKKKAKNKGLTLAEIRTRFKALGYTVRKNVKDSLGRKWKYSTGPSKGPGGSHGFFKNLKDVERYLRQVEAMRSGYELTYPNPGMMPQASMLSPSLLGNPTCQMCEGPLIEMGKLGPTTWYRCRMCGMEQASTPKQKGKKKAAKKNPRKARTMSLRTHPSYPTTYKESSVEIELIDPQNLAHWGGRAQRTGLREVDGILRPVYKLSPTMSRQYTGRLAWLDDEGLHLIPKRKGKKKAAKKNPRAGGFAPEKHRLTHPKRVRQILSERVSQGLPVRFMYKGKAMDISTGWLAPKGTNVMYQPVYWNFTRATANKIAKWLGVKAVFDRPAKKKATRKNPSTVRQSMKDKSAAKGFWKSLSRSQRHNIGDALVLGSFDWRDWLSKKPSTAFLNALDAERIHWEIMSS
jgi:hypothetical protein